MARLLSDGVIVAEKALEFAGESSTFSTALNLDQPGAFELRVLAMDGPNANFGMANAKIEVTE